eukprot:207884_1
MSISASNSDGTNQQTGGGRVAKFLPHYCCDPHDSEESVATQNGLKEVTFARVDPNVQPSHHQNRSSSHQVTTKTSSSTFLFQQPLLVCQETLNQLSAQETPLDKNLIGPR